ncbi:hypothetical protein [Acinetobacter sp. YH12080]
MAQLGLKVLRFDNGQVLREIAGVEEAIYHYCHKESP